MLIKGTRHDDTLGSDDWLVQDDRIFGYAGNDVLYGGGGNDEIHGGKGDDIMYGGPGNDWLLGGAGNDQLLVDGGWGQAEGGYGNDYIGVLGVGIGGRGDDNIASYGGVVYGDDVAGKWGGNDYIDTWLGANPWIGRQFIGGKGADVFEIRTQADDGMAGRVDVFDFTPGQDQARLSVGTVGHAYGLAETFALFDTDGNGVIDGQDPAGALGVTWADPNAGPHGAVCFMTYDGDLAAFWLAADTGGAPKMSASDFLLA